MESSSLEAEPLQPPVPVESCAIRSGSDVTTVDRSSVSDDHDPLVAEVEGSNGCDEATQRAPLVTPPAIWDGARTFMAPTTIRGLSLG